MKRTTQSYPLGNPVGSHLFMSVDSFSRPAHRSLVRWQQRVTCAEKRGTAFHLNTLSGLVVFFEERGEKSDAGGGKPFVRIKEYTIPSYVLV